jgi:hypothetical protein
MDQEELDHWVAETLAEKLREFIQKYELEEEQQETIDAVFDIQRHAYSIGTSVGEELADAATEKHKFDRHTIADLLLLEG